MLSPTKESFRRVERLLDQLVETDAPNLSAHGIVATDESGRTCHYQNPFLAWSYRFESRRSYRGSEIALVTVRIRFNEPVDPGVVNDVEIWSRSEIFQIGQLSRWERSERHSISVADLRDRGIGELVCAMVAKGHVEIDSK